MNYRQAVQVYYDFCERIDAEAKQCGRGWVGTKPPGCKRAEKSGTGKKNGQRKASSAGSKSSSVKALSDWFDKYGSSDDEINPDVEKAIYKAREKALKDKIKGRVEIFKELSDLSQEFDDLTDVDKMVNIPGAGDLRPSTDKQARQAYEDKKAKQQKRLNETIKKIESDTDDIVLPDQVFNLTYQISSTLDSVKDKEQRSSFKALLSKAEKLQKKSESFNESQSPLTLDYGKLTGPEWRKKIKEDMGYSDADLATAALSTLKSVSKAKN